MSNRTTAEMLYEAPAPWGLQAGQLNKNCWVPRRARIPRMHVDGSAAEKMTERFGSPLFVFSEKARRESVGDVMQAFSTRYPRMEFAWSYKTKYLDAIGAVNQQEGLLAKVASPMEYDKVRRLGVPGDRIIFNGPHRSRQFLELVVAEGTHIHVDHVNEIDGLEQLASDMTIRIPVVLRLSLDAGGRFGFNLEFGQALDAAVRIRASQRLYIVGLHCHIGPCILAPATYRTLAEKLVGFGHCIEEGLGIVACDHDFGAARPGRCQPSHQASAGRSQALCAQRRGPSALYLELV